MKRELVVILAVGLLALASCEKRQPAGDSKAGPEAPAAAPAGGGPHAVVRLKSGDRIPGSIVASTQTEMIVEGDDGIERKIPLAQIQSVDYGQAPARPTRAQRNSPAPVAAGREPAPPAGVPAPAPPSAPPPPAVTTRTHELPVGSAVSVRTNEPIDSATAAEGQTFDAEVTRDAKDAGGDIVIPRGSRARIVIKSASKGGRFRGQSDLVLDLQSVTIQGRQYAIDTAEIGKKGKSGVGANRRTIEYTGGGAALGAVIGAIAGGGKGAAIGAGAGAGAGALTQVLTKGGSIKVPVESVLTFELDKPLRVSLVE